MADVKIVDIDGAQWNIKDQDARSKITILEEAVSTQELPNIQITMENGYTCKAVEMTNHYKVGKIHFVHMSIKDLSGDGIGTTMTVKIAILNIAPIKLTAFILRDYRAPATTRGYIDSAGYIYLAESNGIAQGDNVIMGEIIFAEP